MSKLGACRFPTAGKSAQGGGWMITSECSGRKWGRAGGDREAWGTSAESESQFPS